MIKVPEITPLDLAFGKWDFLPPWEEIPEEFKKGSTPWNKTMERWFHRGLPEGVEFHGKPKVDPKKACQAIQAVLTSYGPKHEHKMAGTAYLCSQWFKEIRIPD